MGAKTGKAHSTAARTAAPQQATAPLLPDPSRGPREDREDQVEVARWTLGNSSLSCQGFFLFKRHPPANKL